MMRELLSRIGYPGEMDNPLYAVLFTGFHHIGYCFTVKYVEILLLLLFPHHVYEIIDRIHTCCRFQ